MLNDHWLGKGNRYLTGDEITIADYFGAGLATCGAMIRTEFKNYPNVEAWLKRMEQTPSWAKTNEAMYGFRDLPQGAAVRDGVEEAVSAGIPLPLVGRG